MSRIIYPINNKEYTAEDVEIANCTRTSGVHSVLDFDCSLSGNVLTVGKGLGWIKNGDFSGKTVAFTEPETFTLDGADSALDRYDVVAVRYDATKKEPEIVIIKGDARETPTIPTRNTESYLYELFLYAILRKAGESTASFENVTDLRENKNYCGIMEDSVTSAVAPVYETIYEGAGLQVGNTVDFDYSKYAFLIASVHSIVADVDVVLNNTASSEVLNTFSGSNSVVVGESGTLFFRAQIKLNKNSATGHTITVATYGTSDNISAGGTLGGSYITKIVGVTKQPKGYVAVDDIYNPESHNAQSGEAVKQAIDEALENFNFDIPENVETTDNKVTTIDKNSTDIEYPSAKATYNLFNKLLNKLGLTMEDLMPVLPKVYLTGDVTGISADNYVNVMCQYVNAYGHTEFTDYATIAWQGSSSLNFPVKNYKIKLFTDEEREEKSKRTFKDWHATNNYHLKANFGDCTNFMNNMMMHYLTKSYQYLEPLPRENARYTVDGFPILLYVNDEFSGIYFWNLKQDDKVYNLNEEKTDENGNVIQEADLCYQAGRADNYNNAGNNSCAFVYGALDANGLSFTDAHAEIDHYWEDRVWDKVDNHPDVLYDTIQWVSEATDEEFKANLSNYFDIDYLINYFVCIYTCGMTDSKGKNFNMLYFPDKGVWYPTFWDMDKAFGSGFNGGTTPYDVTFEKFGCPTSRLFDKLWKNFRDECVAKYQELRQILFTVAQVEDSINAVWGNVTSEMIDDNFNAKYKGTSCESWFKKDAVAYVTNWAEQRFAFMDNIFAETAEEGDKVTQIVDDYTITYTQGNIESVGQYGSNRVTASIVGLKIPTYETVTVKAKDGYLIANSLAKSFSVTDMNGNSVENYSIANSSTMGWVSEFTITNNSLFDITIDAYNLLIKNSKDLNFTIGENIEMIELSATNNYSNIEYGSETEVNIFDTYKTKYIQGSQYTKKNRITRVTVCLYDFRIPSQGTVTFKVTEGFKILYIHSPRTDDADHHWSIPLTAVNDNGELRNDAKLTTDAKPYIICDEITVTNGWTTSGATIKEDNMVRLIVAKEGDAVISIDEQPFVTIEGAVNK